MKGSPAPTHDLPAIQQLVKFQRYAIFRDAAKGAWALGLDEASVIDCVLNLTASDFYKTMESERRPGLWQDVYRPDYCGVPVYLKLQILNDNALIISFKEDESK